jgi:hypothetical protein
MSLQKQQVHQARGARKLRGKPQKIPCCAPARLRLPRMAIMPSSRFDFAVAVHRTIRLSESYCLSPCSYSTFEAQQYPPPQFQGPLSQDIDGEDCSGEPRPTEGGGGVSQSTRSSAVNDSSNRELIFCTKPSSFILSGYKQYCYPLLLLRNLTHTNRI